MSFIGRVTGRRLPATIIDHCLAGRLNGIIRLLHLAVALSVLGGLPAHGSQGRINIMSVRTSVITAIFS